MSEISINNNNYLSEFTKGILKENPVFILLLGLCPTLAVTNMLANGIGMGIAATLVLLCSNIIISLLKHFIPVKVRIPAYIVVIASFVTIIQMLMKAFVPFLDKSLGIFVPLIVVNCIILGRAEAFASKNNVIESIMDALGMGLGFTIALISISLLRELFGSLIFDFSVFSEGLALRLNLPFLFVNDDSQLIMKVVGKEIELYSGATVLILPPGAFFVIGLLLALINAVKAKIERDKK